MGDGHPGSTLVVLEPRRCLSMESAKPSPLRPLSLNSAGPRSLQLRSNLSPASPLAATSPSRPSHLKRASTVSYSPRSPSSCVPQSPARDHPSSSGANSTPQSRRASLRAARRTSYDPSLIPDPILSSSLTSPPITAAHPAEEPLTLVERYVGRSDFYHYPSIPIPIPSDGLSLLTL